MQILTENNKPEKFLYVYRKSWFLAMLENNATISYREYNTAKTNELQ